MVLSIKKRFFYYKYFELDIWGLSKSNLDINPALYEKDPMLNSGFLDTYSVLRRRGLFSSIKIRYKMPILSIRISKICGFFWFLLESRRKKVEAKFGRYIYRLDELPTFKPRKSAIRTTLVSNLVRLFYVMYNARQFKRLARKAFNQVGLFGQNYLCLLEGRLCCVVYRAGFLPNLFESIKFIKQGHVLVDNKYQSFVYFYILPMQVIGFNPMMKGTILWTWLRRLNCGLVLHNVPKYMYISYTFLLFFWKRLPKGRELINPIGIDMLRLCNYNYFF